MAIQTKTLAVAGGTLGGIGAVGGGVYAATRPGTIGSNIGAEWVLNVRDDSDQPEFEVLLKKLKASTSTVTVNSLKEIKDKADSTWAELKDWCKGYYEKPYDKDSDEWKMSELYCKKSTILEKLNDTQLPNDGVDEEWTKKVEKAKRDDAKDSALKAKLTNDSEDKTTLQNWCQEQYRKPFDSKLPKNSTDSLLNEVKLLCSLTVKEKIGEENLLSEKSPTTVWKKAQEKKLKEESNVSGLLEPFKALNADLKNTSKTPAVGDEETKKACLSVYDLGYKGETKSGTLVTQVSKYCSYTIADKMKEAITNWQMQIVKNLNLWQFKQKH